MSQSVSQREARALLAQAPSHTSAPLPITGLRFKPSAGQDATDTEESGAAPPSDAGAEWGSIRSAGLQSSPVNNNAGGRRTVPAPTDLS